MFKFIGTIQSAADLAEQVEQFKRGLETPVQGPPEDFGQRLKEAVKDRLNPSSRIQANASSEDESFGEKVKKAAQRHPKSQENVRKNAEKERGRYRKPQRRPATKSG